MPKHLKKTHFGELKEQMALFNGKFEQETKNKMSLKVLNCNYITYEIEKNH